MRWVVAMINLVRRQEAFPPDLIVKLENESPLAP
jgi:hypothetical protein